MPEPPRGPGAGLEGEAEGGAPLRVLLVVPPRRGGPRPWAHSLREGLAPRADVTVVERPLQAFRLIAGPRDLVHTTLPFVHSRRPLVVTLHGDFRAEAAVYRRPYERLLARADAVTTTSEQLRDRLRLGEQAKVIPAALADRGTTWRGPMGGAAGPRVLVASNFSFAEKTRGTVELIDAIARLPPAIRPPLVDVCGGGQFEGQVREAVARAGAGVDFLGWRSDLAQRFAQYDLLLYSSRLDNQPMLLLEAAMAGIPILSTPIGDVPRMLDPSALLHSWEDLAAKLEAARDPAWLVALSGANRRHVLARHSWETVRPAWMALYRSVLP